MGANYGKREKTRQQQNLMVACAAICDKLKLLSIKNQNRMR